MKQLGPIHYCIFGCLLSLLSACSTTYHADQGDGGYRSQQLSPHSYKITYRANAQTSEKTVQSYLRRRAAQLTRAAGYDYFIITDESTGNIDERYQWSTYPNNVSTAVRGDEPNAPAMAQPQLSLAMNDYEQSITIEMHHGQKPDRVTAYAASG